MAQHCAMRNFAGKNFENICSPSLHMFQVRTQAMTTGPTPFVIACDCFVWLLALPAIRHVEAATKDCISFQAKETPQMVQSSPKPAGRETGCPVLAQPDEGRRPAIGRPEVRLHRDGPVFSGRRPQRTRRCGYVRRCQQEGRTAGLQAGRPATPPHTVGHD